MGDVCRFPWCQSCNCDQFQVAHVAPLDTELGGHGWPSLLVGPPTPGMSQAKEPRGTADSECQGVVRNQ